MHRFEVRRYRITGDWGGGREVYDAVEPVIDGISLGQRLSDRFHYFTGDVALPSGQWFGRPDEEEDGRAVVLDGSCLDAGCCGVFARIDVGDEVVTWSDFFARGAPELPDGLEFRFARGQYEEALRQLHQLPVVGLDLDDG